jgi:hypothetical protein
MLIWTLWKLPISNLGRSTSILNLLISVLLLLITTLGWISCRSSSSRKGFRMPKKPLQLLFLTRLQLRWPEHVAGVRALLHYRRGVAGWMLMVFQFHFLLGFQCLQKGLHLLYEFLLVVIEILADSLMQLHLKYQAFLERVTCIIVLDHDNRLISFQERLFLVRLSMLCIGFIVFVFWQLRERLIEENIYETIIWGFDINRIWFLIEENDLELFWSQLVPIDQVVDKFLQSHLIVRIQFFVHETVLGIPGDAVKPHYIVNSLCREEFSFIAIPEHFQRVVQPNQLFECGCLKEQRVQWRSNFRVLRQVSEDALREIEFLVKTFDVEYGPSNVRNQSSYTRKRMLVLVEVAIVRLAEILLVVEFRDLNADNNVLFHVVQ